MEFRKQSICSSCGFRQRQVEQGIDLDRRLRGRRHSTLGTYTPLFETANGSIVSGPILASVLALEIVHASGLQQRKTENKPVDVEKGIDLDGRLRLERQYIGLGRMVL